MNNKNKRKALYKQLVDDILSKLSTGALKVSDRLPPEADYATSKGVSRSTVRLAFSHLEKAGIINRRKRGGTEIIALKPVLRCEMCTDGCTHILTMAPDAKFDLTDVQAVNVNDFVELQNYAQESTRWLRCTGTSTLSDQCKPFVWSQVFVSERYSDLPIQAGDSPMSIFNEVEKRYGVAAGRAKQRYSAVLCSAEIASVLGLKESDSVLTMVAELFNEKKELIQLAYSFIDPIRFKVRTDVNVSEITQVLQASRT